MNTRIYFTERNALVFQSVMRQLEQAKSSVNQAGNEKEKAEAMIAVECMEALASAV